MGATEQSRTAERALSDSAWTDALLLCRSCVGVASLLSALLSSPLLRASLVSLMSAVARAPACFPVLHLCSMCLNPADAHCQVPNGHKWLEPQWLCGSCLPRYPGAHKGFLTDPQVHAIVLLLAKYVPDRFPLVGVIQGSVVEVPVQVPYSAGPVPAVSLIVSAQARPSLLIDGSHFVATHIIEEEPPVPHSFRVRMEGTSLQYRSHEGEAAKAQRIAQASDRLAAARATLAELQQALPRSVAAFDAAVNSAADGGAELSDIGALAIEQKRIRQEIDAQQNLIAQQNTLMQQLHSDAAPALFQTHRITPSFELQAGFNTVVIDKQTNTVALVQVLRKVPEAGRITYAATSVQEP